MKKFIYPGAFLSIFLLHWFSAKDCQKRIAYWREMYSKADSCITIMDFRTQEAKDKVIAIHRRMIELTKTQKYGKN